jgi:hypothetical protein
LNLTSVLSPGILWLCGEAGERVTGSSGLRQGAPPPIVERGALLILPNRYRTPISIGMLGRNVSGNLQDSECAVGWPSPPRRIGASIAEHVMKLATLLIAMLLLVACAAVQEGGPGVFVLWAYNQIQPMKGWVVVGEHEDLEECKVAVWERLWVAPQEPGMPLYDLICLPRKTAPTPGPLKGQ